MQPNSLVHVIDDDEAVRNSLEFLLRTARLEVRTYEFGDRLPVRPCRVLNPGASSPT